MPDQWGTRQEQTTGLDSLMKAVNNKRFDNAPSLVSGPYQAGLAPPAHTLHLPRICAISCSEKPRLRAEAKMRVAPYSATFVRRSRQV
jgi:hypothetical protein